ncbi:hypothetical protein HMPREF9554_00951 [Treponema phagedenis F0421]|nr:hypothetical protein HMPREF9554_00951 [Treponema phagedenis F0421]
MHNSKLITKRYTKLKILSSQKSCKTLDKIIEIIKNLKLVQALLKKEKPTANSRHQFFAIGY